MSNTKGGIFQATCNTTQLPCLSESGHWDRLSLRFGDGCTKWCSQLIWANTPLQIGTFAFAYTYFSSPNGRRIDELLERSVDTGFPMLIVSRLSAWGRYVRTASVVYEEVHPYMDTLGYIIRNSSYNAVHRAVAWLGRKIFAFPTAIYRLISDGSSKATQQLDNNVLIARRKKRRDGVYSGPQALLPDAIHNFYNWIVNVFHGGWTGFYDLFYSFFRVFIDIVLGVKRNIAARSIEGVSVQVEKIVEERVEALLATIVSEQMSKLTVKAEDVDS
ncbi:unnamed protein product, partial [Mesorhabditis spiculigera]